MSLSVGDFETFHQSVHDRAPFEWQSRLLREVVARKQWPRVLDLPTGTGKTTCIDIALFALALDAARPPAERWCPRRIAMVVDRRVVVDQAAERGRKILHAVDVAIRHRPGDPLPELPSNGSQRALTNAELDVLRGVWDALASLCDARSSGESPLAVFTLRGGIPKDDSWARTPDQPLVIASTVDQIGSRLLLRGYGVSRGMRPVHAGLAGNDMLILLDEVHLSQPFKQTLERLEKLRERFAEKGLPRRFQFAFLSATPGETTEEPFRLTQKELGPDSALGPRLYAKKPASIAKVSGRGEVATLVASEAATLLHRHTVVAAVVNRVDTALAVSARLKKALGEDVVLLTGRMRPLDRDDVLATCRPRIATGSRIRTVDERKLVVVGTQCIEAGADFDFDAMVTESASFDGLRQRFGRVDRLGEHKDEKGEGKAEGMIVHDKDEKNDPIYEDRITETMKWLDGQVDKKRKTVDFGSRALLDAPASLFAPKATAPTLLPAYLDLWSQTSPEPFAVPETGLFLHGSRSGPEDVQVIWRADLDEAAFSSQDESNIVAAVAAVPPSSLEAITLPFLAARLWLAKDVNALEGTADLEVKGDGREPKPKGRRALRWRGEQSRVVEVSEIRPGDTLVVPSSYGGIDAASKCFDPDANNDVQDLAERASLMGRGRPLLRLHPRVLEGLGLSGDYQDAEEARVAMSAASDLSGWKRLWAERLGKGRNAHAVAWESEGNDGWLVLEGRRVSARLLREAVAGQDGDRASIEDGPQVTTDDEDSPYTGTEVSLDVHIRDVERRVRDYAQRIGLSDELASDLSLAAWLHDIGKVDGRFQRMLRGGSEIAYYRDEDNVVLAKSAMASGSKAEHRRAQMLSGYPRGTRHEVQSLAMIEAARKQIAPKAHDLDLVMHLVASHHGHCRPFAPAVEDTEPVDMKLDGHASEIFGTLTFDATTSANGLHRLDSLLADRFWSLMAKYGWIELCWLEAIFRLADHRASEIEAGGER